jgi:hypothetical protein
MSIEITRGIERLRLNPKQTRQFLREFNAVRRRRPTRGLPKKFDMGADCYITIRSRKAREQKYRIYGRAVLFEERTGRIWQFYFGLMIAEWLQLAFPGPKAPFNPVT